MVPLASCQCAAETHQMEGNWKVIHQNYVKETDVRLMCTSELRTG